MVEYVYMLMGDIYLYPKKLQFVANGQIVLVTCIYKFNNVFFSGKNVVIHRQKEIINMEKIYI